MSTGGLCTITPDTEQKEMHGDKNLGKYFFPPYVNATRFIFLILKHGTFFFFLSGGRTTGISIHFNEEFSHDAALKSRL